MCSDWKKKEKSPPSNKITKESRRPSSTWREKTAFLVSSTLPATRPYDNFNIFVFVVVNAAAEHRREEEKEDNEDQGKKKNRFD